MNKSTLLAIAIGSLSTLCCAMQNQQQRWAEMDRQREQQAAQQRQNQSSATSAMRARMQAGFEITPQLMSQLGVGDAAVAHSYMQNRAQYMQQQQK